MSETSTATGKVVVNRAMSLDGFIAGPGHAMDWIAGALAPDKMREQAAATGAMLIGRRTAEVGDRMEAEEPDSVDYPFSGPMFVLTHRPPEPPDPKVTYLTGDIARTWRSLAPTWPASACGGGWSTRSWCMYCRCCSPTASASRPRASPGLIWNRSAARGRAPSPSSGSAFASNRCVRLAQLGKPRVELRSTEQLLTREPQLGKMIKSVWYAREGHGPRTTLLGSLHKHRANEGDRMKIEFLSTVAVIAPDPPASRKLYVDALGLPLKSGSDGEYHHSEQISGCKHFGVWPLSQAAEACFGTTQWPAERLAPQISIEFDVASTAAVGAAAQELQQAGYELLHPAREEPWGQTVARLQSPEGAIVGISYTPSLHD
jgi:catechol 2,3-dioxygenase-like lactoylglutathione lyase family enzyme